MYSCTKQSQLFVAPMYCRDFILFQCKFSLKPSDMMISPSFNSSFIHLNMCSCVMFMWLWILKLSSFSSGILIVSLIVFFSVLFCVTCARFNASFGFFLFLLVFCLIQEFFQRFLQHSFLVGFYLKIWIGKTSCLYYNPFTHFWYSAFIDKTLVRNTSYT